MYDCFNYFKCLSLHLGYSRDTKLCFSLLCVGTLNCDLFYAVFSIDCIYSQRAPQTHLLDRGGQSHRLRTDAVTDGGSEMGH